MFIFISDNKLMGAFSRATVDAYEGHGRFHYGLVEIGNNSTILAGTGMGVIRIGDNVRTLPGKPFHPSHLQNVLFAQTLRYAQNFILGILSICLR